jgi:hypothetical protein
METLKPAFDRLQGKRVHVQIVEAECHEAGPRFALRSRGRCRGCCRLGAAAGLHVGCETLLRERRDGLSDAGVVDLEVIPGETGNRAVLAIADHHRDLHHIHLGAQSDWRWRQVGGLSNRQAETGERGEYPQKARGRSSSKRPRTTTVM